VVQVPNSTVQGILGVPLSPRFAGSHLPKNQTVRESPSRSPSGRTSRSNLHQGLSLGPGCTASPRSRQRTCPTGGGRTPSARIDHQALAQEWHQLVVEITGRRERYAPAGRNAGFRRLVLVPQCDVIGVEDDPLVRTRVTELDARESLVRAFRLDLSV